MPRILIVDDIESDRELVRAHLSAMPDCVILCADSGRKALQQLESLDPPDLVVTDLQMPQMTGLELVRTMRRQYPRVPVVLITAHGSELIAVEALKAGAASYVPKSHLRERLVTTVEEIFALAEARRSDGRALACLDGADFDFRIGNDPEVIPPVVDLIQNMLRGMMACDRISRLRIGVALEEALLNALYHGNLELSANDMKQVKESLFGADAVPLAEQRRNEEPYASRSIYFRFEVSKSEARFVVRDEGPGFDNHSKLDPTAPGGMNQASGRGLVLISNFMDEVSFNSTGNEITLIKQRDPIRTIPLPKKNTSLFDIEREDKTLILVPKRSISSFAEEKVYAELRKILGVLDGELQNVVIDFGKVSYFGSAMLEAMRMIRKQVSDLQGRVALCNVSPVGKEILRISKIESLWPVCESVEDAIEGVCTGLDEAFD